MEILDQVQAIVAVRGEFEGDGRLTAYDIAIVPDGQTEDVLGGIHW